MSALTKESVRRALERPITEVGGYFQCRICEKRFPRQNSVPVHELTHRREVGLAPRMVRGSRKAAPERVVCRYNGCTAEMRRSSLTPHLVAKHGFDRDQASFYARKRREEDLGSKSVPARVVADEVESGPTLTDLSAAELVTGILSAVRIDGLIPVRLLPSAHTLIEHVDAVLGELRELS